jgi:hypothetical protein
MSEPLVGREAVKFSERVDWLVVVPVGLGCADLVGEVEAEHALVP